MAHFSRSILVGELVVHWVFIGPLAFLVGYNFVNISSGPMILDRKSNHSFLSSSFCQYQIVYESHLDVTVCEPFSIRVRLVYSLSLGLSLNGKNRLSGRGHRVYLIHFS